jgi:hypothetical protein
MVMEGYVTARPRSLLHHVLAAGLVASFAGTGCSNYIGTTASSYLRRVREDPDPNIRYLAYAKLASPQCYDTPGQKAEAVKILVEKFQKGREPVASRAVICRTLGELRDPAARDVILKAVNDPDAIVRIEACRALGKVGKEEDATVLTRVMTLDTLEDCRIAAIDALAELKPRDPRITKVLVAALRSDDPATRFASLNSLRHITGRDLGVDPAPWQKLVGDEADETMIASKDGKGTPPAVATASVPAPSVTPAPASAPGVSTTAAASPQPSATVYPPRPPARPDSSLDSATRPVAYPPAPRSLLPQ